MAGPVVVVVAEAAWAVGEMAEAEQEVAGAAVAVRVMVAWVAAGRVWVAKMEVVADVEGWLLEWQAVGSGLVDVEEEAKEAAVQAEVELGVVVQVAEAPAEEGTA